MLDNVSILVSFGRDELKHVHQLRYEILRKPLGLPASSAIFAGDEFESTIHILAKSSGLLIGCATIVPDEHEKRVQLRGMAVDLDKQGIGIGKRILDAAKAIAKQRDQLLWCNARFSAIGFYEHQGLHQSGPVFEIPGIGKHVVMKYLSSE
ncbi:MAG: GNAT family N-acetyltransferase [Pirellula sp.]|nr:GNAT family N-acetyltransferase [Pirellula sp.]